MEDRTRDRLKKQREETWIRRRKKLTIAGAALLVILVAAAGYEAKRFFSGRLAASDIFRITTLNVRPPEWQATLSQLLDLPGRNNLLSLDPDDLQRSLLSDPVVEKCRIRKIYPSTLDVEIEVRKAWVLLTDYGCFIDRTGIVVPPPSPPETTWNIDGISIENGSVTPQNEEKVPVLRDIEKWYNAFNIAAFMTVTSVGFSEQNKIVLRDGSRQVFLEPRNLRVEFENLKIAMERCSRDNFPWEYIDVRFANPYVKKAGGPVPPKEPEETPPVQQNHERVHHNRR